MNRGADELPSHWVFIGTLVPDKDFYRTSAFSRAGNMYQENLIRAFSEVGQPPDMILSQRPLRSFPRSKVLWSGSENINMEDGTRLILVPFINLPFIRPLTVGLISVGYLLAWGWQHRHQSCRLVCTYNLTEPPGLFTLLGARLARAKAVALVMDINVPGETVPPNLPRIVDYWLQRRLIPAFDGLVVASQRMIQHFAPDSPHIRLEGGISDQTLRRGERRLSTYGGGQRPFTVVATGSLEPANGLEEILDAFKLIPGENIRLKIAGAGAMSGLVKAAAERDRRIDYLGYLSFDDVQALYDEADLLVNMRLTKRIKTDYFFPSKMMEYLASGVPVLTTRTGHVEKEYSSFVYILEEETAACLAETIQRISGESREQRQQLGQSAIAYMRLKCTWRQQVEKVSKFFHEEIFGL